MAENYGISCLVGFMDDLWFRNVILSSDPYSSWTTSSSSSSSLGSNIHNPTIISSSSTATGSCVSEGILYSSISFDSGTPLISQEDSASSTPTNDQGEFDQELQEESDDHDKETIEERSRPTRLNNVIKAAAMASSSSSKGARSHSSSPSHNLKRSSSRNLRFGGMRRLQKTMSCKSLCELELEEVRGFLDLGFVFNKDNLSKRMMSLIPGLQRLDLMSAAAATATGSESSNYAGENNSINDNMIPVGPADNHESVEVELPIFRPYLSEAWLVRRPDSPLLNIRIPRVSTAADMKKHLKYWARTVASAVEMET